MDAVDKSVHTNGAHRIAPEELESKEFVVGLRGFDQREVKTFLKDVASDYRDTIHTVEKLSSQPEVPAPSDNFDSAGSYISKVLRAAEESASEMRADAKQLFVTAQKESQRLLAAAKQDSEQLITDAKKTAAEIERASEQLVAEHEAKLEASTDKLQKLSEISSQLELQVQQAVAVAMEQLHSVMSDESDASQSRSRTFAKFEVAPEPEDDKLGTHMRVIDLPGWKGFSDASIADQSEARI